MDHIDGRDEEAFATPLLNVARACVRMDVVHAHVCYNAYQ